MRHTLNSNKLPLLAFGAHPDDIEFGCGGIIAKEILAGRDVYFVVCSLGEAATNGNPEQRREESTVAAETLGASIEFLQFDGDSHLQITTAHTLALAATIRKVKPSTLLSTSCVKNQHPDHSRLGQMVRDAARLARYGGMKELSDTSAHSIEQLFYYAVTPDGEPRDCMPILIDISDKEVISKWTAAMTAHKSQSATRNYTELQLTRAKLLGARAGVEYAMALYSNDPLIFDSLSDAGKGARRF